MTPVEVTSGVVRLPFLTVNAYLVGEPGGPWAVVDTGMTNAFEAIVAAAAERYGKEARPAGIYLTHGHPDHVGSALALAVYWDVPIYVHTMEMPYLTGKSDYPPLDPTMGGPTGLLARFLNAKAPDLSGYIQTLPEGELPGMPGWEWVPTLGHSPGHVSYFRRAGRVLLAGDACGTIDMDHWDRIIKGRVILSHPASAFTPDWGNARKSMKRLAKLLPNIVACGHGVPMSGANVGPLLESVAEEFIIPLKGRYVSDPARFDENGVTFLPPAPPDPLPRRIAVVSALAAAAGVALYLWRKQKGKLG